MKNYLVLLCIAVFGGYTVNLNAQTNFKPGFVIQQSGDTLRGEIDYRGDLLMGEICRFRVNENVQEFYPEDIRAYRFNDGKFYVSKVINNKSVFLEYLVNGELDIYYLRDLEGDHYYAENAMLEIREIPYSEGMRSVNGKHYQFRSKAHMNVLQYFTNEAPDLASDIQRIRKPTHRNLTKLAENYHEQVCYSAEECIIYEKNTPILKTEIEFLAGPVTIYQMAERFTNYTSLQAGYLLHINMPRVNEKIYFRTGVLYAPVEFEDRTGSRLFKFPAQFEYIYPKGAVRPKLYYGLNIYRPLFVSVAMGGGFNVAVNESVALSFTYDIDFVHSEKIFLIPQSRLTQAAFGGVIIKL